MRALLASCALCLVLGVAGGWKVAEWRSTAGAVKQVVRTVYVTRAQGAVNTAAAAKDAQVQTEIRWRTQTIVKEVPHYVSSETDRAFPLSNGFVRVHDAASRGLDVSDLPDTPAGADGEASPVAASRAAAVIAGNYGACRADQARLAALQGWVLGQAAAFDARP